MVLAIIVSRSFGLVLSADVAHSGGVLLISDYDSFL